MRRPLIHWILLLQEFDLGDKRVSKMSSAINFHAFQMHLQTSCQLMMIFPMNNSQQPLGNHSLPTQSITQSQTKPHLTGQNKIYICYCLNFDTFLAYLFKYCSDQIIRRCVPDEKIKSVLSFCHELSCGRYFGPRKPTEKYCRVGFISLTCLKMPLTFARRAQDVK